MSHEVLFAELQRALSPRIQLVEEMMSGGMGTVFLGRDPALKRNVVVKVLLPELAHDPAARARFAREAESAAAVSHANVVSVFQVGELPDSGTAYFVMQWVDGLTLQKAWPTGKMVPEPQARRLIGEVASALDAAHQRGLIHRDIKPSNIMLERDGGRAVVLDFGISAALGTSQAPRGEKLTMEGMSIGTPEYMSPEQAAAEPVTPQTDVYSLGVVAFELLAGRLPFTDTSPMALIAAHIKDAPPAVRSLRPDLDPQLAELVDRALRKEPAERPAAADIARTLLASSPATVEWPPPGLERLVGQGRAPARLLGALALLLATVLFTLSFVVRGVGPAWYRATFGGLTPERAEPALLDSSTIAVVVIPALGLGAIWMLVAALYTASSLAGTLRWARAAGYPWRVLFDVAMDRGPDTGHLLSGTGPYGLLDQATRSGYVSSRRRAALAQLGALAACVPAVIVLLAGWLPEPGDPVVLVSATELLGLAAVPLAAWVYAGLLRLPEARLRWRLRRSRGPRLRRAAIRPELVTSWLGSTGHAPPRASGGSSRAAPALVPVAGAAVLGAILMLAVLTVTAGSRFSSFILGEGQGRQDAIRLLRAERQASLERRRHRLDSLLARAGALPTTGARGRAAADTLMLIALDRNPWGVWLGADAARARVRTAYPDVPRARVDTAMWRAFPGRLSDAQRALLAADTAAPRLHLWRLFAGADSLAPLWMIRPGFGDWYGDVFDLQDDRARAHYASTFVDLARRNMAAALLAMDRGDAATALLRARENLAVARQLGRQPLLRIPELLDIGQVSLRELARLGTDSALRTTAAALKELTPGWEFWWFGDVAAMADPLDPPGLGIIADSLADPAQRWRFVALGAAGACMNTREVLFGPSARRSAMLGRAATLARDIPRTDEWVAVQRRRLASFDAAGPWQRMVRCLSFRGIDDRKRGIRGVGL